MNIDLVIAQLRSNAPVFGGNVGGAAQYEKGVQDQTWMALPAAYVVPLATTVEPLTSLTGYVQEIVEKIGVIVAVDNTADRRGQAAVASLDQVQRDVLAALMNWRPDSTADSPQSIGNPTGLQSPQMDYSARGLTFDGGELLGWDLARLFWSFDFSLVVTISAQQDGWQPSETPLTSITLTATTQGTEDIMARATLPQS